VYLPATANFEALSMHTVGLPVVLYYDCAYDLFNLIIIIIMNIFSFNCAFSKLICTNLCKQIVSHNTPLRELQHVPVILFLI
jgi:hypothetical protein